MENFILYEKLGSGSSSVVQKGRMKGSLNYVAIVCSDKMKRPEIVNHVSFKVTVSLVQTNFPLQSKVLVCFCHIRFAFAMIFIIPILFHFMSGMKPATTCGQWWNSALVGLFVATYFCLTCILFLIMFVLTAVASGGSLESIVTQDGYLSEDVVRSFGWGLVQGLHYIHEMGVIFSDLTPAKVRQKETVLPFVGIVFIFIRKSFLCFQILLDNSGILKFSNFCHSKAEGETTEDFMALLSTPEISEQGDVLEQLDRMKIKLKGEPNKYQYILIYM